MRGSVLHQAEATSATCGRSFAILGQAQPLLKGKDTLCLPCVNRAPGKDHMLLTLPGAVFKTAAPKLHPCLMGGAEEVGPEQEFSKSFPGDQPAGCN